MRLYYWLVTLLHDYNLIMSRKNKSKFSKLNEKKWQKEYSDGEDLEIDKFELPPSPEVEKEEE